MACHITGVYDVNRTTTLDDDNYELVRDWAESVAEHQLQGIIFHNNFTSATCEKFKNDYISFIKIKYNDQFNPNVYRYFVYNDFLQHHVQFFKSIFVTDITDVTLLNNPFIDSYFIENPTAIFCGDEPKTLNNDWMRDHSTNLRRNISDYAEYENNGTNYEFVNAKGYTKSMGTETFFKFGFYDFVLFVGYTYTDATNHFSGNKSNVSLTPKHSLKGDLLYALPGKWRIGVDYELKSGQTLSNGNQTPSFWTYGADVEYYYKKFTFFGNIENVFDYRQTRQESLISGPNNTPQFTEVWAPLDGFVFNFGLKIKL